MTVPPAGAPPPQPVPWERRRESGTLAAFGATLRESLLRPVAFFRALPPVGPLAPALGYAILVSLLAFSVQVIWEVVLPNPWPGLRGRPDGELPGPLQGVAALAFGLVCMPVVATIVVLVMAGIYHGLLLVFGGPSRGYVASARAVAYASGAQLLGIVPLCGWLFALAWGTVMQVIAVREVHGLETGKAVAVVLVPFLLCVAALLALAALVLATLGAGLLRGS